MFYFVTSDCPAPVGWDGASLVAGPLLQGVRALWTLQRLRNVVRSSILEARPLEAMEAHMAGRTPPPSKEPSSFQPTIWTQIDDAKKGNPVARDGIYHQYRKPVLRFLEKRLPSVPLCDSEALADDVMLSVLAPGFLSGADRAKGRFRDLLLAVARYRMFNYRRWLKAKPRDYRRNVTFEEASSLDPATEEERHDFDGFYADEVFREAFGRFRQEAAERRSPEADALDLFYREGLTQAEIAEKLGCSVAAANNHLARGRGRLKKHLLAVLGTVCRDGKELDEELKQVLATLGRAKRPPGRGMKA